MQVSAFYNIHGIMVADGPARKKRKRSTRCNIYGMVMSAFLGKIGAGPLYIRYSQMHYISTFTASELCAAHNYRQHTYHTVFEVFRS